MAINSRESYKIPYFSVCLCDTHSPCLNKEGKSILYCEGAMCKCLWKTYKESVVTNERIYMGSALYNSPRHLYHRIKFVEDTVHKPVVLRGCMFSFMRKFVRKEYSAVNLGPFVWKSKKVNQRIVGMFCNAIHVNGVVSTDRKCNILSCVFSRCYYPTTDNIIYNGIAIDAKIRIPGSGEVVYIPNHEMNQDHKKSKLTIKFEKIGSCDRGRIVEVTLEGCRKTGAIWDKSPKYSPSTYIGRNTFLVSVGYAKWWDDARMLLVRACCLDEAKEGCLDITAVPMELIRLIALYL